MKFCFRIRDQDATQLYQTYPALIASAWPPSKSMRPKPLSFWNWGVVALVGLCARPQNPVNELRFQHQYSFWCSTIPSLKFLNKSRLTGHGSGSNPRFFHGFVDEDGIAYLKRCLVFGFGFATVPNQLVLIILDPMDAFDCCMSISKNICWGGPAKESTSQRTRKMQFLGSCAVENSGDWFC